MSTTTIAVGSRVYARLAAAKRTGSDILRGLANVAPLPAAEAEAFLAVIAENRCAGA